MFNHNHSCYPRVYIPPPESPCIPMNPVKLDSDQLTQKEKGEEWSSHFVVEPNVEPDLRYINKP